MATRMGSKVPDSPIHVRGYCFLCQKSFCVRYFIVEKTEKHTIEDSEFDIRYIGDTDVFVINVPSEVKQKELHAWFRAGMISGDPLMQEMKEELNKAQDQLRRLILMEEK